MPSLTTEGIILKRNNFGEADRMLTVLTDRFGKISVAAKGIRRITSRRAGNVEALNRVRLHVFKAKSYTLTEAESIEDFEVIKSNLALSTYAFHVLELVDRLVPEEQKNPEIYALVLGVIELLKNNPRQIFIRAFEIKFLAALGFWSTDALPQMRGGIKELLQKLQFSSWEQIGEIEVSQEDAIDLERILRYYIEKILESPLRSSQVLKQVI